MSLGTASNDTTVIGKEIPKLLTQTESIQIKPHILKPSLRMWQFLSLSGTLSTLAPKS